MADRIVVRQHSAPRVDVAETSGSNARIVDQGEQGPPGPQGPQGPGGIDGKDGQPRFTGIGPPPLVITGASPGDEYYDEETGNVYVLM